MTNARAWLAAAFAAALLMGCAQSSPNQNVTQTAEKITRAVYANDLDTTVANFDDATKKTVSRSELGLIADKMHELGEIRSFTQRTADPDRGRYDYDVRFTNGAMLVEMRIDPDGKVGGYYVVPEQAPPSTAATTTSS